MVTWQFSSRMPAMTKIFIELLAPTLNKIAISAWFVSSTPVDLHAGLNDQSQSLQINNTIRNKTKDSEDFFESNINMAIQSHVLNIMGALTSLLYM